MSTRPYRRAFWTVAFAFLAVMAIAGVPSPLYGLYRERDHFIGTVMAISSPDRMAESVAAVLPAAFVGLSLPVVGAGVTLASHVSPKVTILGFAIVVSVGIVASALKLAGGPPAHAPAPGWR